ncbi:MAG: UDP-N-acetylmuramate:L-alanyl-gamma-D-glutamyl-meso-diaminopimelate ligase [Gammaproteobacteria bacterium]|nr:UDP-N-acetylmuramate:L-alanyl-gamma-D-glutamyl-meso-diaminopimelate ligase [Gammaproteobacteria bacterium]
MSSTSPFPVRPASPAEPGTQLHILGICGTLMGSLALLARELGFAVSGTDANVYPPMSDQLREAGIELSEGYTADSIPDGTELVMLGNAGLARGNPAVEAVLDRRLPYLSGAEWLGRYVLPGRWVIAASGTHGKTTTTAMITWILEQCGLQPGYLIGGVPHGLPGSARLGDSIFFAIEADEYDTSYFDRRSKFMHYRPDTLIFGNLEFDHADIFADLAAIEHQFHHLIRTIPSSGLIVAPSDDDNVSRVLAGGCWTPVATFGPADSAEWSIDHRGCVIGGGKDHGHLELQLLGEHNRRNALAAIAATHHAGVAVPDAIAALASFRGVKRRMETIYESTTVTVYDDFAHHPTAIATTLAGLRERVGDAPILAIIEPASHTMRRGTHGDTLAAATDAADEVIWFRPADLGWNPSDYGNATAVHDDQDALLAATRASVARGMRHVVIMSNGGFGGFHRRLVDELKTSNVQEG